MKTQNKIPALWTYMKLILLFGLVVSYPDELWDQDDSSVIFEYKPVHEIRNLCQPFLSSASELSQDDVNATRIRKELSFDNGDWDQAKDTLNFRPLMPFDEKGSAFNKGLDPLKLVNFEFKDVSSLQNIENAVFVGGVLSIGITRSNLFKANVKEKFYMKPGLSVLTIVFEGVYTLNEENGGKRIMCLLGNTTSPSMKHDDQILLVLRYPNIFNLTRRVVLGEMKSLRERGSAIYFDKVLISSQLGQYSKYQFGYERIKPRTCDTYVYQQELIEDGFNSLNGSEFCRIMQEMSYNEVFSVFPNYNLNYFPIDFDRIGPFTLGKEIGAVARNFDNVRLIMQHVKCVPQIDNEKTSNANISVIFRVISVSVDRFISASRTGLSGLTLSAEGTWDSSSGQLCMVGCWGIGDSSLENCDVQISMYFPQVLLIKQRSIVLGSMTSVTNGKFSFSPIMFNAVQRPFNLEYLYGWYAPSYLSYNYSKIHQADEFRKRNQLHDKATFVRKSLMMYPSFKDEGGFFSLSQIYDLTNDLYIDAEIALNPLHGVRMFVKLEVLSLGPFLARYDWLFKVRNEGVPVNTKSLINDNGLVNVSVHLVVTETRKDMSNKIVTPMYAEGFYDPQDGKMYLIGCGKVGRGMDLERGLDCMMEVDIQYPSKNTQWLRNPTVKINVKSQRKKHDSFYLMPIHFKTRTIKRDIIHGDHEKDVVFRLAFEGVLRIVLLSTIVAILRAQQLYMNKNAEIAPYMSFTMLGFNILGYGLPLLTAGELLFPSKPLRVRKQDYKIYKTHLFLTMLDYTGRTISFAALFLTIMIYHKVSELRKRLNAHEKRQPPLPEGGGRFLFWFIFRFLLLGSAILLLVYLQISSSASSPSLDLNLTRKDIPFLALNFVTQLGRGLQVFFLLPQIVENFRWKVQAKCLRKSYYIGIPLVMLVLSMYDGVRDPVSNHDLSGGSEPLSRDLDLASLVYNFDVMVLVFQVVLIHIQQSFNYLRILGYLNICRWLNLRKFKFLLFKRRLE